MSVRANQKGGATQSRAVGANAGVIDRDAGVDRVDPLDALGYTYINMKGDT